MRCLMSVYTVPSKAGSSSMPFCPEHWGVYCMLRRERLPLLGSLGEVEVLTEAVEVKEGAPVKATVTGHKQIPSWFGDRAHTARRSFVVEMYGGRCVCCGEEDPVQLDLDHVAGRGGTDREIGIDVLQDAVERFAQGKYRLLCAYCHRNVTRRGRCEPRERVRGQHVGAHRAKP